jgi:hypothetical protein
LPRRGPPATIQPAPAPDPTPGSRSKPPPDPLLLPGLVLAGVVALLAAGLAGRQVLDWQRRRGTTLSAEDTAYFRRQDRRRALGSFTMLLAAAGIALGLWLDPRSGPETRRYWAVTWLSVMACVVFLLILSLRDWLEIRRYAFRHIAELSTLRHQTIRQLRRPPGGSNGHPPPAP